MNRPEPAMAAVVLCGGASSRMGSPKALIDVEGRPLVTRVAELIATVADPVFLATGKPGRLGDLGWPEVEDVREGVGPLGGLIAGLEASPHRLVAAVAADMPLASPQVMQLLARLHVDEDAVVPLTASGFEPLHAVYWRGALPALRDAIDRGTFGLRALLQVLHVRSVKQEEWRLVDPNGSFALNINRPEDLSLLG